MMHSLHFQILPDQSVELLLAAAGGGGASAMPDIDGGGDAMGILDPRLNYTNSTLIPVDVAAAGSGGGWLESLSGDSLYMNMNGRSLNYSWMGGLSCQRGYSNGGFGGGGGACVGGGGGGGFIGGRGGEDMYSNGGGGWSWFNPESVLLMIDSRYVSSPSDQMVMPADFSSQASAQTADKSADEEMPRVFEHVGQGFVNIMPPLYGAGCQSNCSDLGATCLAFDKARKHIECVCPNGKVLSHRYPSCNQGQQ